ncbi:translation initiation factor IF-3 [Patescibacteria group bacterium]|nr:translation initiation factor IF-3 [Patescibacteria group bacterium]
MNDQIRVPQVRLIDDEQNQIGVIPIEEALRMAKEKEMDLAEVSPNTNPSVCKLMDYGKYLYKQKKVDAKHKKMQKQVEVKGVRLSMRTGDHDLQVKVNQARKFLGQRNLIKVQLIFKGREAVHKDLAINKLNLFAEELKDIARVDELPKRQGNTLIMILAPLK